MPELSQDLRADFPALVAEPDLVYLDSAATSLKPQAVVDEVAWFLGVGTAAIYRGVHRRGVEATERFEDARAAVARWFGVADDQVVFTRGATDGINLVRAGLPGLRSVVTTVAEHHSNLLPWRNKLDCRLLDCDELGLITPGQLDETLRAVPADLVAVSHVGNVLGNVQPVRELADVAHRHAALLLVDAAQSASHLRVGPDETGADLVVCSGHKTLGPSGVGALVGRAEALERLTPVAWGGGMVESVDADKWDLQPAPRRWEAGTPPVEAVLGWAAAIEYLERLGRDAIHVHLESLTAAAESGLSQLPGVRLLGAAEDRPRAGIVSMQVDGWESHAAARVLSQRANICVRSGFHCAEPLHQRMGLAPTLRASFHVYNTLDDVERLTETLSHLTGLRVG